MAPRSFLERIFTMLPSRLTAHVVPHACHIDVVVLSGFPSFWFVGVFCTQCLGRGNIWLISDWVSRSCLPVFPFSDLHQIIIVILKHVSTVIYLNEYCPTICPYIYLQAEILRIKIVEPIWNALSIKTELPIICPLGGNNRYCNRRW